MDWYSDCGNGITAESFDVRVVAKGRVQTYNGPITTDQTIEVTRFTVGSTGDFGPFSGMPVQSGGDLKAKKEQTVGDTSICRGPTPSRRRGGPLSF